MIFSDKLLKLSVDSQVVMGILFVRNAVFSEYSIMLTQLL